jgi:hypothetical protein
MSDANYFISSRQILESEKLIKIKSLTKCSGYNFSDVKDMLQSIKCNDQVHFELDGPYLAKLPPIDLVFEPYKGFRH